MIILKGHWILVIINYIIIVYLIISNVLIRIANKNRGCTPLSFSEYFLKFLVSITEINYMICFLATIILFKFNIIRATFKHNLIKQIILLSYYQSEPLVKIVYTRFQIFINFK